ncbi:hypothetical protein RBSWK_04835 [Rhodopirellula baltica SWK14]|uniref:Uncharacterized protein n=1 Tax=Rhodopirellula baltica SWK14 TaxID=993516 RepID=L7CBT0_RHOBT|nr:hypothetical protein RBSWK_04835 [Rhodopirellula baltica SWK14]
MGTGVTRDDTDRRIRISIDGMRKPFDWLSPVRKRHGIWMRSLVLQDFGRPMTPSVGPFCVRRA